MLVSLGRRQTRRGQSPSAEQDALVTRGRGGVPRGPGGQGWETASSSMPTR